MQRLSQRLVQTALRRARDPSHRPSASPCARHRSAPPPPHIRTNSTNPHTKPQPPAAPAAPPPSASAPAQAAPAGKDGAPTIPDINSTTLGIEHIPDPFVNDPLKWRKFLWKYAGAVATFLVAYKALNLYVDKVQADGQRRRDELEENKELRRQFDADQAKARRMLAAAHAPAAAMAQVPPAGAPGAPQGGVGAPGAGRQAATAGEDAQTMSLFKPIQEEEGFVSELDELRTLQVELLAKHKALGKERRQTDEVKKSMWDIEGELKDLEREIEELERAEAKRKTA